MFQPISHPIWGGVDPAKISQFLHKRERFETMVEEKAKEVEILTKSSFRASVDPDLLRCMYFMEKFNKISKIPTIRG